MLKKQKYQIEVILSKEFFDTEESHLISYFSKGSQEYQDSCKLLGNKILIEGERSKSITIDIMLETQLSTYYSVLIKILLHVYIKFGNFEIISITSKVGSNTHLTDITSQIFSKELPSEYRNIDTSSLFSGLKKSDIVMYALMYLVQSVYYQDDSKFEYVWKAFNVLIREASEKSKKAKEFDRLKFLRKDLESSPEKYPMIFKYAKDINSEFLDNLWIAQMITNNIEKNSKNEEEQLKKLVDSFSDERVLKMFINRIECKKDAFKDESIESYRIKIRESISKREISDIDIIRLIILKYAYFLRNKFFHAERWPAHFLIDNDNLKELNKISDPVAYICIDMINSYKN